MSDAAPRSGAAPAQATRIFASFLTARAIFGLVYLGAAVGRLPVFWYHPFDHTWELASKPTGLGMGWYGLTAAALGAAALGGGLTFLVGARGPLARALARASVVLALAHAGGLVLLVDFAYFGWTLTHDTPKPWPEPECPREGGSAAPRTPRAMPASPGLPAPGAAGASTAGSY